MAPIWAIRVAAPKTWLTGVYFDCIALRQAEIFEHEVDAKTPRVAAKWHVNGNNRQKPSFDSCLPRYIKLLRYKTI